MSAPEPTPPSPVAVSVVIPAYNAAPYIAATLESVFAQTFTDYEVIVVNDGSSDTPALEQALLPYRPRIVYISQSNGGAGSARNTGIRRARGTYVAFLDSDDLWMPEYLAEQMRILAADPSLDLLYSNGVLFGDSPAAGRTQMTVTPSRGAVTFESLLEERCTVLTSSTVVRREAVIEAGLFDERLAHCEDVELWLRLAFRGRHMTYHRKPLVRHLKRRGSLSDNATAMTNAYIEVMQDIEATFPVTERQRSVIRRHISDRQAHLALQEGKRLFLAEQYEAAAAAVARSSAREPSPWKQARLRVLRVGLRMTPRLMRRMYDLLRPPDPAIAAKGLS
jgi:glycosyltransferase involved in cell wall biosynthesis